MLGDDKVSFEDKQAAITKFYATLIDETTHTGDLKVNGGKNAPEVGRDATDAIFNTIHVESEKGKYINVIDLGPDQDVGNKDVSNTKDMIKRKTREGGTDVIPTVPQKK